MGINSWFINQQTLVGGLENEFYFPQYSPIAGMMIQSDLYFSEG